MYMKTVDLLKQYVKEITLMCDGNATANNVCKKTWQWQLIETNLFHLFSNLINTKMASLSTLCITEKLD